MFGVGNPLPANKLPLYKEVGSALIHEAEMKRMGKEKSDIDKKNETQKVTDQVLDVYSKESIPTITYYKVREKVDKLWVMRREALVGLAKGQAEDCRERKKKNGKVKRKFCDVTHELFDIADDKNVPDIEKEFLEAQRQPGRKG